MCSKTNIVSCMSVALWSKKVGVGWGGAAAITLYGMFWNRDDG